MNQRVLAIKKKKGTHEEEGDGSKEDEAIRKPSPSVAVLPIYIGHLPLIKYNPFSIVLCFRFGQTQTF
jgi:hypothetical protein